MNEHLDLQRLRAELDRARAEHGRGSSQGLEAFQRLFARAHELNQSLSALPRYIPDETARFFAGVIAGDKGHCYWRVSSFKMNSGRDIFPNRWWWNHAHATKLGPFEILRPTCGHRTCIAPAHQAIQVKERQRVYTDMQMIGALQVVAMRLGHPPSANEWTRRGGAPSVGTYKVRFGSWSRAHIAAGLGANRRLATPSRCIAALQLARRHLGYWPTSHEFPGKCTDILKEAELPHSRPTISRHLGSWPKALYRAGKR